jgi:UTP--glucose-1-phosphate uridylyltransferase
VIPAAGLGTRFLPATKAVPKELLPVVDKPALQYIVEEAAAAGIEDVLVITGRGKGALVDHFDRDPELESALQAKGDQRRLAAVMKPSQLATIYTTRQDEPRGLGHAVLCAADHVGDEPFAVMLGDDLIDTRDPLLTTMIDVQAEYGGAVIALLEVPREHISLYGAVAVQDTDRVGVVRVTDMVEKPPVDEAPSNLAMIGRYVLPGSIFPVLRRTPPGRGDEIQLTDAIALLNKAGEPVHGVVFTGRRYDTGDKVEYLKAVVRLACDREDLGPEFRTWLAEFVGKEFGWSARP